MKCSLQCAHTQWHSALYCHMCTRVAGVAGGWMCVCVLACVCVCACACVCFLLVCVFVYFACSFCFLFPSQIASNGFRPENHFFKVWPDTHMFSNCTGHLQVSICIGCQCVPATPLVGATYTDGILTAAAANIFILPSAHRVATCGSPAFGTGASTKHIHEYAEHTNR